YCPPHDGQVSQRAQHLALPFAEAVLRTVRILPNRLVLRSSNFPRGEMFPCEFNMKRIRDAIPLGVAFWLWFCLSAGVQTAKAQDTPIPAAAPFPPWPKPTAQAL